MTKRKKKRVRGGASYPCIKCHRPSHVKVTRKTGPATITRHRECLSCGRLFYTIEEYDEEQDRGA